MPKKGDNLESITAVAVIEHHKNAVIVQDDLNEIPCVFHSGIKAVQLKKAVGDNSPGINMELTQPHAYISTLVDTLIDDEHVVVKKYGVSIGDYDVERKRPDGSGLTLVLLIESQPSDPGRGKWQ